MKKSTILLTCLLLLSTGTNTYLAAQTAVTVGSQVTSESAIVSGKAYVLKTGVDRYITDNGTNYDVPNSANSATEASLYYLISNGDGTWKIKNYYTRKYWGIPVYNNNLASVAEASAGTWSLNFSGGIAYPSAPDANSTTRGIDRSDGKVVGWSTGDNANHKVYIYEVSDAMLLTPPVNVTSGWYQIRWITLGDQTGTGYTNDSDVDGKFVRNYATEVTVSDKTYPLYLAAAPTTIAENALSLVYVEFKEKVKQNEQGDWSGVHCFLRGANGHYIKIDGSVSTTATDNYIIYVSSGTPNISTITSAASGTRYSLVPRGKDETPYIGQTESGKFPKVNMYAVKPAYLGLEAWTVKVSGTETDVQVNYGGSAASGLTSVYNGGTFFLTSGVTPAANEFTAPDVNGVSPFIYVDATNHIIQASYPTADLIYTLKTDAGGNGNGALIYNAEASTKWLWSSGKSGTFDASSPNSQWIFYPTGTSGQYYLYNVGAQKFAIPVKNTGNYSGYTWMFSSDAVAVSLTRDNGYYRVITSTGSVAMSVSNGYTYPIISYGGDGGKFAVANVATASSDISTQVTAAVNSLFEKQTALTAPPTADGWYAIKIQSHTSQSSYAGNFIYPLTTEYVSGGYNYPLGHATEVKIRPSMKDATYFFKFIKDGQYYHWQLANGKYVVNQGNNYPTSKFGRGGSVAIEYQGTGYFDIKSSGFYVDALASYMGKTDNLGQTKLDIYPIDLTTAGLSTWQVIISGGSDDTKVTCSNASLSGLSSVYNNGYFFLPTGTTPLSTDFAFSDATPGYFEVDGSEKTITALYNPSADGLTASEVAVIQGNETTGKGNTMQALLRVKLSPTSHATPTQVSVSLTGTDQLDNVAVYTTTGDELRSAGASPVKVSDDITPASSLDIPLTMSQIRGGRSLYLWITADVKSTATEWETIDAAITAINYNNIYGTAKTTDLTSSGNPDGVMRIYKQQTALWTPSHTNTTYYRIPTMINTADGGIVALSDLRYDHPNDLGKTSTNGYGAHKIDVVSRRSTDGGLTWESEVTVAAGDGSNTASSGYGDPAIVRDADGTLHCLMAAGPNCYAAGMHNMAYSKSTDNGASWSAVTDIYSDIDKGGLTFQSAFTTGGKGVTFDNGRMAFAFLGKVSGTTNIYPIYSDDKGATWHVQPTVAYGNGDESKLEIMNDNSLLLSVRKGSYNGTAIRAHNRTTGDASGEGIGSWGTASNWGSEMNANGCNADILYYNRSTEDASRPDVIFHTLTKAYNTYRKDLRLYMSFDQGATWQEAFQLQAGYAAYSSMQKLANGDLAIIFEDGSIGNKDKQDCYAINYIVISKEKVDAKIDELVAAMKNPTVKNSVTGSATGCDTWGTLSNKDTQWTRTWTSNASSGVAGLTITSSGYGFDKATNYNQRVMTLRPSTDGGTDVITITAPSGYVIDSYTITGRNYSSSQTYKFWVDGGNEVTTNTSGATLTVNNVNASTTSFNFYGSSASSYYLCITNFIIQLRSEPAVALNTVGDKSYATLYLPYDVTTDGETKAYYITSADNGYAKLTEVTNNEIPAYTAVILVNDQAGTSTTLTRTDGLTQQVSQDANLLKGTLCSRPLDLSDATTYYSMGRLNGEIGFYKYSGGTITLGANKAYLDTSASGGNVKGFLFNFGVADGILDMVNDKSADGKWYDLSGRPIKKGEMPKGIYITNGKKIIVK